MTNTSIQAGPGGCAGNFGRVLISLFLLIFVGAGLFICVTGVRSWRSEQRAREWPSAPCTITRSFVRPRGKSGAPYEWRVEYRYDWAGRSYTSDQYAPVSVPSSYNYADAERLLIQHPRGARSTCWVNPSDPAKAVLAQGTASMALWALIPFGLVFAAFGAIPLWLVWSGGMTISGRAAPRGKTTPLPGAAGKRGRLFPAMFFLVFAVAGAVGLWFLFVRPMLRARAAGASWAKVPCTVVYSGVAEHPGSGSKHGPTYSMDVLYSYSVGGRQYLSNQFDFLGTASSGQARKLALARQYPRGRKTVCYVNPADPLDAVLQPNLGNNAWWAALPAIFLLVGLVGFFGMLVGGRRGAGPGASVSVSGSRFARPTLATPSNDVLTLRMSERRLTRFVVFAIFALIFDAALVFIAREVIGGHASGWVCAGPFLLLWAAGCVGITGAAVHAGLAMFNPRATVTLARGAVAPGASAELQWTFDGRYDRIQRLTLRLEGRERATYRQGTDTRTDTNVFATVPLFETDRNDLMARGKCTLHVPAGAMHTFRAAHNEIRWFLVLHGEIPNWPDVKDEFEIEVPPPPIHPAAPLEKPPALPAETPARSDSFVAIRTTDGRTAFSPGEPVAGIVSWSLPAAPRRMEVRLFWFTRGKGTQDVQIVEPIVIENAPMQGQHPFTFHAPNGPYSFSGRLISLIWGLEVLAEPKDRSDRIEIVCAPGGREIVPDPALAPAIPLKVPLVIGR
jgi:hypothetical protein